MRHAASRSYDYQRLRWCFSKRGAVALFRSMAVVAAAANLAVIVPNIAAAAPLIAAGGVALVIAGVLMVVSGDVSE